MDSPENDQAITKTALGTVPSDRAISSSASPSVQESPIFSYISNLSPIKPVKTAHAVHGILELSSPPPLFTSPSACKSISLKRPPLPQSRSAESKKPTRSSIDSEKSIALITDSTEGFDVKDPARPFVFSACVNEYPANSSALDADAGPIFTANYDSRRIIGKHSAVEEYDDCSGHPCTFSDGSAGNTMLHDLEAGQVQRGMLRRCLIFEDDQSNSVAGRINTQNPMNTLSMPNSPSSPDGLEISDLNCADLTATSSDKQLVNLSQPETAMIFTQNRTKPSFAACKPSSIGLHLNSVVNSLPTGCSARSSINLSAQRLKSEFDTNFLEISSACINDEVHDNAQHPSAWSDASQTLHEMKPLSDLSNQIEHYKCTPEKRKSDSEHSDNFEESRQMSPKKKQKKPSRANEGDACKSCNCKKTKCLKLYCDCFAAGIYCAEACACQGCSNRPENEQTVLETRRQIESRNPLAFAPRVQHLTATAANPGEDGNGSAPSSARHKKGCNCKKSGCLKKYCECFQANVGCSDGCRCVGCKNVNGRKEDYGLTKNVCQQAADETSEKSLNTDHGKNGPKIHLPLVEHFRSPESDVTILPSFEKVVRSSRGSDAHEMPLEAREVLPDIFCDEDLNFGEAGAMDSFTPRFEMGGSTCWLSSPAIPTVHSCTSKFLQGLESERADIFEDASSALNTVVEVRSPNQKRISPPRGHLHEAGPSSCVGLRGGRKFILRSVPSFPTITPCVESKSIADVREDSDIGDSTSK